MDGWLNAWLDECMDARKRHVALITINCSGLSEIRGTLSITVGGCPPGHYVHVISCLSLNNTFVKPAFAFEVMLDSSHSRDVYPREARRLSRCGHACHASRSSAKQRPRLSGRCQIGCRDARLYLALGCHANLLFPHLLLLFLKLNSTLRVS